MLRFWLAAALLAPAPVTAQEPAEVDPAAVPGPFRLYVVTDGRFPPKPATPDAKPSPDARDRTGKLHDFVTEQGLNPVVAVFTRAAPADDGAAAKVARGLAGMFADKSLGGTSLGAFVAFLTLEKEFAADDQRTPDGGFVRDEKANAVRTLADAVKAPRVPFGLAAAKSEPLTQWGVTDADETVVVVYNRMRVVKRFAYPAGAFDDAALKEVLAAARGVAGK